VVRNNRATALLGLLRPQEAIADADMALLENPNDAQALYNRGAGLMILGQHKDALANFNRALSINPHFADALTYRGIVLAVFNRHEEAIADYNAALAIKPGDIEILYNRATSLWVLKRFEEVIPDCERVLKANPNFKYARGILVQGRLQCADWNELAENKAKMSADLGAGSWTPNPLQSVLLFDNPQNLQQSARMWTAAECAPHAKPLWQGKSASHKRLRIGYMSGDFRLHAVALLIAGVFESHDKPRFETMAISTGPNDGSPMRRRLEAAFDRFVDVTDQDDAAVAGMLHDMELDILVDLNGFTLHGRTPVMARRPSGIQVNYLGYPGTMGAPYIDYIIADRTVIPEAHQPFFDEKVVYLPNAYLPNDSSRAIGPTPSRAEAGLPETGFVFGTFNDVLKITPEMFSIWMRLLQQVPGSVLWQARANPTAMRNLRREAEARGIAGERIVFAPYVYAPEEHLARLRLVDLFLDTLPYNGHATACDALWVGVPIVSLIGQSFAGRVGASVLNAVGLPELIANDPANYEALALKLARDSAALAAIKAKLVRQRDASALFDTARFTRHLEAAYLTMWERQQRGEAPASFAVDDISAS
jgi:predicted O-linked N-acetylglucosamine transferase (SPINDLY family)